MKNRRALTQLEVLVIILVVVALVFMLRPRARGPARRAVCAANLRGIGQSMHIYSTDNDDWFPIAPHAEDEDQPAGASKVSFVGRLAAGMTVESDRLDESHTSRSLFLTIIQGHSTPKQFICPGSGDSEDELRNGVGINQRPAMAGVDRFDFAGYDRLSYGYQLPFGSLARPRQNLDVRMAVMADKGPYFEAGEPRADGTVPDRFSKVLPPTHWTNTNMILRVSNTDWRPYNSRNHGGEGQNVLFVDDHVIFRKNPLAGVNSDNIYTVQSGSALRDALIGLRPDDKLGPMTATDTVIVP